jgi:hypothetical protein
VVIGRLPHLRVVINFSVPPSADRFHRSHLNAPNHCAAARSPLDANDRLYKIGGLVLHQKHSFLDLVKALQCIGFNIRENALKLSSRGSANTATYPIS